MTCEDHNMMRTIVGTVLALLTFMPPVAQAQTEQVFYYHTDAIGSVRMITDATGQVVARYDYLPFGEPCGSACGTPSPPDVRQFAGRERDQETGLDYFGARYYASVNRYAYAGNNPLRFSDPSGLDFYLQCEDESTTCHEGRVGSYVKDRFQATLVTSASLADPNSGNSAVVNGYGLQITTSGKTYQGIFINGTPSADITGDPNAPGWNWFSFHITGSDVSRGNLAMGTARYLGRGGYEGMMYTINNMNVNGRGPFIYPEELIWNPFHPGAMNFRFSAGSNPELFNYGPSPHFSVGASGVSSEFHVDNKTGVFHVTCAIGGVWCY